MKYQKDEKDENLSKTSIVMIGCRGHCSAVLGFENQVRLSFQAYYCNKCKDNTKFTTNLP